MNKIPTVYRARAEAAEKALSRYRDENLELENRLEAAGAEVARLNQKVDALDAEAEALGVEADRLRGEIEDYMLWEPGRAGHAAAHERLRAALAAPTKEDADG